MYVNSFCLYWATWFWQVNSCSKWASIYKNCIYLSSDAVRAELYGNESIQGDNNKVFSIMLRRAKEAQQVVNCLERCSKNNCSPTCPYHGSFSNCFESLMKDGLKFVC